MQRGYNTVEVSVKKGGDQKIVWVEVRIVP